MSKPKVERITTPRGVARYPWLTVGRPDERFHPDGVYSVHLIISKKDFATLKTRLDQLVEESYEKAYKEAKTQAAKKKIKKVYPYQSDVNDDGEDTDDYLIKIKSKAQYTDQKTGETIKITPKLFDAKGALIEERLSIYGGSILKVNFTPRVYCMKNEAGVSLRLNAVQVIELVTGSASAESFGFDEEEGYEFADSGTFESAGAEGDDDPEEF